MRIQHVTLIVVVVGLVSTVWLPFVNSAHLWLGLPALMVWTVIWVLLLAAALAWIEYGTPHPDDAEDDRTEAHR